MRYNPIVRNFGRLRRVLMETVSVPRCAIRPSAKLADLIPREERRRVWERFQQEKLNIPGLCTPRSAWITTVLGTSLLLSALGLLLWPRGWFAIVPSAVVIGLAAGYLPIRFAAKEIDSWLTIGDVVMGMTSARECREAGYCLSRNEIFLKVRTLFCKHLAVEPAEIKPETTMQDLFGE